MTGPSSTIVQNTAQNKQSLSIGHKLYERSERFGNEIKTTTTYQTFQVIVEQPSRGIGRPAVSCPVCGESLRVGVLGAATQLRLYAATIGALVACVLAALAILIINGFDVEEFGQGGPSSGWCCSYPWR